MGTTDIKKGPKLLRRAKGLVAKADSWRASAEKVLYWATCSVDDPGESKYNDTALALVDRCFKVNSHDSKSRIKKDIQKIKKSFRRCAGFYAVVKKSERFKFLSVGPPSEENALAYAEPDGWRNGDTKGLVFVINRCESVTDTHLTDIITHESIHFAAGIGHSKINGKVAYGTMAFRLSNAKALKNASNYAYLAYLARMPHTKWLTAT